MPDRLGRRSHDALHSLAVRGRTCADVAEHIGAANSTAHDALRRLMRMGMVACEPSASLGRYGRIPALWRITPRGRARLQWEADRGREPGVTAQEATGRRDWPQIPMAADAAADLRRPDAD